MSFRFDNRGCNNSDPGCEFITLGRSISIPNDPGLVAIWLAQQFHGEDLEVLVAELSKNLPSKGDLVVRWLEDRFRESPRWKVHELKELALESGFVYGSLFKSVEIASLPIKKSGPHSDEDGGRYWTWEASPGWPKETDSKT